MAGKADIMGLSVDVVEQDELCEELKQYLQNEYLNVVFFVTIQMIERSVIDPEYKRILESSDYLLPAGEAVLSAYPSEELEKSGVFKSFQCLSGICARMEKEGEYAPKTVYYIGKTREETQQLVDYSSEKYPWMKAQGMYCEGMEERDDLLVNEINSVSPDVLVVALESPFQEEWIFKNSTKLNARLCVGIGRLFGEVLKENRKKGKFLRFFETWEHISKKIHENIFQKKAGKYLEKKEKNR